MSPAPRRTFGGAGWPDRLGVGPSAGARPRILRARLLEAKTMPKLSDTQAVLLAAAAARSDLSVLPAPETLRLKGAALERTLKALRGRGLIAAAPVEGRAKRSKWADPAADAGERERLIVTPAGRAAIAAKPGRDRDAAPSPDGASSARTTKNATLITLLSTEQWC